MNVALLNLRVTFQKSEVVVDSIGNHTNDWSDYYSCYGTISSESGSEKDEAGEILESTKLALTVRYSSEIACIRSTEYRVVINDELYNITAVDHMNYKRKCIKFWCEKVRR